MQFTGHFSQRRPLLVGVKERRRDQCKLSRLLFVTRLLVIALNTAASTIGLAVAAIRVRH